MTSNGRSDTIFCSKTIDYSYSLINFNFDFFCLLHDFFWTDRFCCVHFFGHKPHTTATQQLPILKF